LIVADDLPCVVEPDGWGRSRAGHCEGGERPAGVQEAITVGLGRNRYAHDLSEIVDPEIGGEYRLKVRETIKEIAQLDSAFVVNRDETVEAACQFIDAPNTDLVLPRGLGTRHWAAEAITHATEALAIVVSRSTGTVRLFQEGEIIHRIAPMRHARAMNWADAEVEPPPARAARGGLS
jgi:hypothetical protein